MSTVSQELRQAREAQNISVHQLGEITKIRTDHIRALEEGNFEIFSAPVYIKGFTRTLATILKMDVPSVMGRLDAELKGSEKFAEPPPLTDDPKGFVDFAMLQLSKLDWRKALPIAGGALLLLVVLVIFRSRRSADPLTNLKPGVYHGTQGAAGVGRTLPLPTPKR